MTWADAIGPAVEREEWDVPDAPPDLEYECDCSWVGGDPDEDGDEPTCPACLAHDGKRVVVKIMRQVPA